MDNVQYEELKIQEYFRIKGIKVEQLRNIFKLRTRMAPFGDNFRGNQKSVNCPLCDDHVDDQVHGFQCPVVKEKIDINIDLKEIYSETITIEMAEIATKILKTREEIIESRKRK